jgi:hypothetical protein
MKIHVFILWLAYLSFGQTAWAQFSLTPNHTPYKQENLPTNRGQKDTPLNLPFFDDFSNYTGSPNKNLWEIPSGAFVNQTFAKNPISVGVVTFDGLKANGSPYSFSTVVVDAVGVCDTLTSKPINLLPFQPTEGVFLSFFWQEEGFGERPDITDSLYVEFLDNTNEWHYAWGKLGGNPTANFKAAVIKVNDAKYFHNKFQFRILSYGRQSGMYDAWHVDYVYLNRNRNPNDTLVEEITASKTRNTFLKKYSAMPFKQYFANPTQETSDSLKATINNLSGSGFDVVSYKMVLEDTLTKTVLADLGTTSPFILGGDKQQFPIARAIPPNAIANPNKALAVRGKIISITGDGTATIPPIDLKLNDTLTTINMLSNYLAYDDGSPEYGAGVNQRFGKVAIRFQLNEPDTLTDIHFHFTKFEKDLTGQSFTLYIWQEIAVPPFGSDVVKYRVAIPIRYSTKRDQLLSADSIRRTIDGTFRFPLIPLPAGTFYIGWEQTNNDRVLIGYDLNNNSSSEIFFNVGNQWTGWEPESNETGSLLFRPVFSKDYLTAHEKTVEKMPFRLYPNPAQNIVNFEGNLPESIEVIDLQGRRQGTYLLGRQETKTQIDIQTLPKGFYVLRAKMPNGKVFVTKLVVVK